MASINIKMTQKSEGAKASVRISFTNDVGKELLETAKVAYELEILNSGYIKKGTNITVLTFDLICPEKILKLKESIHRALIIANNQVN